MAETMSTNSKEALIGVFVVSLERLGRDDLALAGGKGTNLGELVRLSLDGECRAAYQLSVVRHQIVLLLL